MVLSTWAGPVAAANLPWNYAVQVSATVDAANNQVTLRWPGADPAANPVVSPQHVVYRKRVADLLNPDWGAGMAVPDGQNTFVDTVESGVAYEYKVARIYAGGDPQYNGVGYVRTGINVPLVEDRGTVLLVVESSIAAPLSGDIDQLTNDLVGDGWHVVRIDGFSSTSAPADLQARIRQEYNRSSNVQAVFLLGHLPVVFSGNATNPDGHMIRPMPADGFYGDVTGDWGSPTFDGQHWVYPQNTFPVPLALAVGRVDFADMPAIYAVSPYSSEVALLRNYLAKDHAFRMAQRVPQRRALIGDAFGEYFFEDVVEPFSADAYRNFAALFGDDVTVMDNFHGADNTANWIEALSDGSYAFAYGAAPGGDTGDGMAALGPNGLMAADLVTRNAKADFYLLFGSFMVDWSVPNNLLRATLAPSDYGLACAWSGRPFLYFHAMGLGETIGYAFRLSENMSGSLYDTPVTLRPSGNTYFRGVYLALLGDPTLRLDPIPPVADFAVDATTGIATWQPPAGVVVREYRVYHENAGTQSYELEATLPASATAYTPIMPGRHMIRVVTLQTGSGTYMNESEGTFWSADAIPNPLPAPNPVPAPDPVPPTPGTVPVVHLALPLLFTPTPQDPGPRGMPK